MDLDGDGEPDVVPQYVFHSLYLMGLTALAALVGGLLGHALYNLFFGDASLFPRDIAIGAVVSLLTIVGVNKTKKKEVE